MRVAPATPDRLLYRCRRTQHPGATDDAVPATPRHRSVADRARHAVHAQLRPSLDAVQRYPLEARPRHDFVLIGASFVPYWGGLLPTEEALVRLPLVGAGVFLGCVLVCCEVSDKIIGASWALFAGIGLLVSGSELSEWLPPEGLTAFWIGVCCYAAQQVVYSIGRPDPLPGVFGFRESQHAFLLAATTTHSAVALTCT